MDAPTGDPAAGSPQQPLSPRPLRAARAAIPQPAGVPGSDPPQEGEPTAPPQDGEPSADAVLIRRNLAEIGPRADRATAHFYAVLFLGRPELREMFPAAMDAQRERLFHALLTAAERFDDRVALTAYLSDLGRGHRRYGTHPTHYPALGEALLAAVRRHAPVTWDGESEAAWARAYTTISQIMIDAAAAEETRSPAWWQAEVVVHERRTPDIAVITVRPDRAYPFLAGQYTAVETPWWPRVWRQYSFASAPRPDGLLVFHVRAVPAGWVSQALVHRAVPGDVLRLGAPAGAMTVDHTTHTGLLCLGGGTGMAPIRALVEDVAEHGDRRRVDVFCGARSERDLYDLDAMLRLQRTYPWLAVHPVVASGRTRGRTGEIPQAVRETGPWDERDAYLAGPPGMIRRGVHALRDVGIPVERIHHDAVEEPVLTDPG
ncbi:globin domain-containing protein [Streptomyces sp. NPDC060198]|uniref:globin domain-containing protein n=1 Tax=Streptomyces sp. NPDC060198 TaxID=3347070 RepID=UPI00365D3AED